MGAYEVAGIPGDNIPPVATASATPSSGEIPLEVQFSSEESGDSDGQVVTYSWDFDNGSSSTEANPWFSYQSAGIYTAVLTVTDDLGVARTDSVIITVTEPVINQAPVAVASGDPTTGEAPLTVDFDGSLSYDNDGMVGLYSWDFGDNTATETGDSAKHTYASGTYTATLTVTDEEGATSTDTVSIIVDPTPPVTNTPPVADTSATLTSVTISKGKSTTVTLDGSNSSDFDGSIVSNVWHEGSSVIGEGMTLSLNRKEGIYTFSLMVTDNDGTSSVSTPVTVTMTKGGSDGGSGGNGPKCNKKNPC